MIKENAPSDAAPSPDTGKEGAEGELFALPWFEVPGGMELDWQGIRSDVGEIPEEWRGKYNVNDNLLAFVDRGGVMRIGASDARRLELLHQLGYERSSRVTVVFSNQQRPSDPAMAKRWENIVVVAQGNKEKEER